MYDCLIVFFIECKEIAIGVLRSLGGTDSAFFEEYFYFSKIRISWPHFENTLSYVHKEVYSAVHDKVYIIWMITFLKDKLPLLNF
jgi:hypothetical protein